jgi:ADP-ribose pyrophosphatase YjhB (NUDIX family)
MLQRHPSKKIMPDVWMAPGGKREFNEGLFECARREIFEETKLKIKNLRIKATGNAYLTDLETEMFFHFVLADWAEGELIEEDENGILEWLTVDEIKQKDNLLSEIKEIIPYLFDGTNNVISYKAVYEKGNKLTEFLLEDSN